MTIESTGPGGVTNSGGPRSPQALTSRDTDVQFIRNTSTGVIEGLFDAVTNTEAPIPTVQTNATTGATELVGPDGLITRIPGISMGEIALYGADEYIAGVAQESGIPIPSATIDNNALGTTLTWTNPPLLDTSPGVWDVANPSRITIPAGVTEAWFTGSVMFPPNGTGARWVRLTKGATNTHMSNILLPTSHAVASQSVQLSTGWIPVVAGDYYELRAVQDSGSTLTPALGSATNKGGSTFFRVAFK